ncbi:heme ABC exporter ATP-binding protein CcmA [Labrenzia sp. 011]|uniref:heme ABC exporter ATP-binding protein CcmA n=1 Tax=Labrenzia sp. 011 TaxID=2171494 RepID=UPI000D51C857|nr:heme ABC exporter ATP-binding protein CcmA [Labrenzia sp. 011]PVB61227.1 heme ABC exporter ATP-binding protein CcmA [Labrenzia sp. 011]
MKLIAENLTIDRGGRRVFEDLSFSLNGGSALVVTGANGIGKSSLLRTLAGLVPPSHGSIRLEGGAADTPPEEQAHYFGHQDAVKPALSVEENLQFWQNFTAPAPAPGFSVRSVTPLEALDTLGIGHTAQLPAAFLSAGQKRRLSLCRLLVTSRPVWLMDEPTSALDRRSETQLLELMNAHLAAGGLIVTATHSDLALADVLQLHLQAADAAALPVEDALP